jgi:hypothetical protein
MHLRSAVAVFGASLSFPVLAADERPFSPPTGCDVYATVQLRNCQIEQLYRCGQDAPGDQWDARLDGEGLYYISKIDSETRWVTNTNLETGEVRNIGPTESDPASFTDLLNTGRDTFDFETTSNTGDVRRYVGFDELTGEKTVIDGVPLERTYFESTTYFADGSVAWVSKGNQYIHREWRRFFADTEDFENYAGDRVQTAEPPVDFAFPGEKGFLSTKPIYDCDVLTAQLAPQGVAP